MIPINKPLIFKQKSGSIHDIEQQLGTFFPHRRLNIVFSGRQGLDQVYKYLYQKNGSLDVAVSPLACFDALYPIIRNGHKIRFVDIDQKTFNMDENQIPEDAQVIQPIHFGGNPQDMGKICACAKKNGQIIIEDCAQALGSFFNGQIVGSFGDFSVFSLMKNAYGLGGGLIASKEQIDVPMHKELGFAPTAYRVVKRYLESKNTYNSIVINRLLYGLISLRPVDQTKFYDEYTVNQKIIDSIYSQLLNFDLLLSTRIGNAKFMLDGIKNECLEAQQSLPGATPNYTRLYFVLNRGKSEGIISSLRKKGISANHITQDSVKYFQNSIFESSYFSQYAEKKDLTSYREVHDKLLSIPVSPNLSKKEMLFIIDNVNSVHTYH